MEHLMIKTILILTLTIAAHAQEYVIDNSDDIQFNESSLTVKINRQETVIFYRNLLMIKSDDPRNKNDYTNLIFSDRVLRIQERTLGFDSIVSNEHLRNFVELPDHNNRLSKLYINKEKLTSLSIRKITQERGVGTISLDGLSDPLVIESDLANFERLKQ
jgi:hypothetical protein